MMVFYGLDVVYVSTINPSHVSLSLMMLAAGKHVLCEKPMSLTTAGAQKVIDFAKQKQLLFVEVSDWYNNKNNKWSQWFDERPHRPREQIVQLFAARKCYV